VNIALLSKQQTMNAHHGQLIEYTIRRNGYSISDLARELCINRRSIYNYFKSPKIRHDVLLSIGKILRHDFSRELPGVFTQAEINHMNNPVKEFKYPEFISAETDEYKEKYLSLLEKYNDLLELTRED
jgi:AcrR family transcriptional regulator